MQLKERKKKKVFWRDRRERKTKFDGMVSKSRF
jgi:hypothetical protein